MPINFFNQDTGSQIPDFSQLGALGKIGLALQNVNDGTAIPKYQQALANQTQQNLVNQARENELKKQSALQSLYADPAFISLPLEQQLLRQAQVTGDGSALANYQASQQITPYQQAELGIRRQAAGAAAAEKAQQLALMQQLFGGQAQPTAAPVPVTGGMSTPGNIAPDFSSVEPVDLNGAYPAVPVPKGPSPELMAQAGLMTGNSALVGYAGQLQARQDKLEAEARTAAKDLQAVKIPGVEIQPGYTPTADDAKKTKVALASYNKLVGEGGLLERYGKAIDKYGSEMGGAGATDLAGLKTDINLELKNVNELGALAGPDQQILNDQLYDLTSTGANARGGLLLPLTYGMASSPRDLANQSVDRLKATIKNNVNAGLSVSGYQPLNPGARDPVVNDGWTVEEVK